MGWLGAIIAGGLAGWIAEKIMNADHGLLLNIILGIVGALVLNAILGLIFAEGFSSGFFGRLIAGIIGACILIGGYRAIKGRT